jgi:hypothetical protein
MMTRDQAGDFRLAAAFARARAEAPAGTALVVVSITPILTPYRKPGQDTRCDGWTLGIRYEVRK